VLYFYLQDLVEYYQEHSLSLVSPDLTTALKIPCFMVMSQLGRKLEFPQSISLPSGIVALNLSDTPVDKFQKNVSEYMHL